MCVATHLRLPAEMGVDRIIGGENAESTKGRKHSHAGGNLNSQQVQHFGEYRKS